jgi:hypothetical protein
MRIKNAAIGFTYAVLYGALSGIAVAVGVAGCGDWNKPRVPTAQPGAPCGYSHYYQCFDVCCSNDEACRPGGYCAFVGETFGASQDGGAPKEHRGITPEEARKAGGR